MTTAWRTESLGDVCHVLGGGTPPKDRQEYYSGNIPWATVRDMRADVIASTEFSITNEAVRNSATNVIPGGNVVIATRVGLGKVCLLAQDTAINQDLRGIIPKDPAALTNRFLFWWFRSIAHRIEEEGTGATVQGVKLPFIKSLRVPLPPSKEQQRISRLLDDAFAYITEAIANAEKGLANSCELFESALARIVSEGGEQWQTATLGAHVRFIDYRGKTPRKAKSGLRLITAKNVRMGFLRRDPEEFVSETSYDAWMTRGIPRRGDVLFTTEAPLANVAQLDTEEKVVFAQRIIIMQPESSTLDSTFLKYVLLSAPVQRLIHERGTGATATGIKASLLKQIPISFPKSLREQRRLADHLEQLTEATNALSVMYERKLQALTELKQSFLRYAFGGQL